MQSGVSLKLALVQIAARREQFAKEIEAQEVEDKLRREQEEQAATRGLME